MTTHNEAFEKLAEILAEWIATLPMFTEAQQKGGFIVTGDELKEDILGRLSRGEYVLVGDRVEMDLSNKNYLAVDEGESNAGE